jgi:hypothetical protein
MRKPELENRSKVFTGPLGKITMALDPHTEADPIGVHMSLMAAFSAAIGGSVNVELEGPRSLMVWPVLVGRAGEGHKGRATTLALRVVKGALPQWSRSKIANSIPATALGLVEQVARYHQVDDDVPGSPLFVCTEGDSLIHSTKREMKFGAHLRNLFDRANLEHITAKSNVVVEHPRGVFLTHVQPKNWAAISNGRDASGGTWSRMLPVFVEKSKELPVFGRKSLDSIIEQQSKVFRQAVNKARDLELITVSGTVSDTFEKRHRPVIKSLVKRSGADAEDMTARCLEQAVRIAALYAAAEGRDSILARHFDAAIEIIRYSVDTVIMVTGSKATLPERIRMSIEARGGKATKSEVWEDVGRNYTSAAFSRALLELPEIRVTSEQPKKGGRTGRPPTILELVKSA